MKGLLRWQPYLFGFGIVIMSAGMSFAGSYGVPRRHYDVDFTGAAIPAGFDSAAHFMLGVLGVGAVIAFLALMIFILVTVVTVFFGKSIKDVEWEGWQSKQAMAKNMEVYLQRDEAYEAEHKNVKGTLALVLVLLVSFVVYYFANWKALADVWLVR